MRDIFVFFKGIGIHIVSFILISLVLPLLFQTILIGIVQPQSGGVTPEQWAEIFREGGLIGSRVSFFLYVIWYASGLIRGLYFGMEAIAFFIWCFFVIITSIAAFVPAFYFEIEISKVWLVWITYGLNSLGAYYFSTALFSPPSLSGSVPIPQWLEDIFN
jgi:hypothetical protein